MVAFETLWFALMTWVSVISFTFPRPKHHGYHRFTISTLQFDANTVGEDNIGFISTSYDADTNVLFGNRSNKTDNNVGLYIHIPYCRQRCRYCDFAIVPIGDHSTISTNTNRSIAIDIDFDQKNRNDDEVIGGDGIELGRRELGFRRMNDRYVSAIVTELKQIRLAANNGRKVPLKSVYFGGGTPSLAPIESIEKILYHACAPDNPEAPFSLQQRQKDDNDTERIVAMATEITMEMDPGTFDRNHLSSLRALGINRISLGVQSFDDDLLCGMGRTHRQVDVLQAIRDIASVFGENQEDNYPNKNNTDYDKVNYSIDLISGCPGLTPAKWVETLEIATAGVQTIKAISTKKEIHEDLTSTTKTKQRSLLLSSLPPPQHISVYDMQIEEGTVFGKWATKAKEEAANKSKGEEQTISYREDDDDDDASRQFTVALPVNDQQPKSNQQQRLLRLPTEDECAFMYKYAAGYLRAKNFEHYEVSSYAAFDDSLNHQNNSKDDHDNSSQQKIHSNSKRSRHNQIYWEYDGQWHAVGLGATSFVNKKLVARPRGMNDYLDWVVEREYLISSAAADEDKIEEEDVDEDFLSDLLLKRLRTIDGLDLTWLESHYGSEVVKNVLEGAKLGLELELAERSENNVLRLTDPDG